MTEEYRNALWLIGWSLLMILCGITIALVGGQYLK